MLSNTRGNMAKKEKKEPLSSKLAKSGEKIKDTGDKLKNIADDINKLFGEGTASVRSVTSGNSVIEKIPTGMLELDYMLGGGMPKGRVVEIFGPESSGKTTLALHMISQVQRQGGIAAFVDAEHALDPEWAKTLGVNMDELLVVQPDSGERALEATIGLSSNPGIAACVVDSVAALVPMSEVEGDVGDPTMGSQARMMSQGCRKLVTAMATANSPCLTIFLNQIRMKIGVMFGNPETTTGGNALKFYASTRIDLRRASISETEDGVPEYNQANIKIVKNKVGPPYRKLKASDGAQPSGFAIHFDTGLMFAHSAAHYIKHHCEYFRPFVEGSNKRGTWYEIDGVRVNGAKQLADTIQNDPEARRKILKKVCETSVRKDKSPIFDTEFYTSDVFDELVEKTALPEDVLGDAEEAETEPEAENTEEKETKKKKDE